LIEQLNNFATTEPATGGLFESIGVDWKTLILQIIAFLILVWFLGKYVYPWLMKSVDERQASIEAATKAAAESQLEAKKSEEKVEQLLKKARVEAADIVATAKLESAAALSDSEEKAQRRTKQIISDAQVEIQKEVIAAKEMLHNETIDLVALATEKVVGRTISSQIDASLIEESIGEAR